MCGCVRTGCCHMVDRMKIAAISALAAAVFIAPQLVGAAESIPDLSGQWGRLSVDFEQPASGPGPITNLNRKPDGSSNGARRVGNYNDPNLTPAAAAEIKRLSAYSLKGETF